MNSINKLRTLVATLAISAGCAPNNAHSQAVERQLDAPFIAVADAQQAAQNGALILDTRIAPAFLLAHPQGAIRVAWDDFSDPDQAGRLHPDLTVLADRIGALGVSNDRPVVVIGAWDDAWGEEGRIVWMLRTLGHTDVRLVHGGFGAWSAAGLPIARGTSAPTPATFTPHYVPSVDTTFDELDQQTLLLDVRTQPEFDGAVLHGEARGGHVDGAVHLEWTDLLDADGNLRTPEEIRAVIGAPLDAPIAAYCTGGVRSAFVWAALEYAGYTHASNYAGSWWEYAALVP